METWKKVTVPGFESYSISSHGRVRGPRTMRKVRENHGGYLIFNASAGGKQRTLYVHKCVAEAFLGPCPEGMQVNHKDGDKWNNVPENLEYVTPKANTRHAMARGLRRYRYGEEHQNSTITEDVVREIRRLYRTTRLSCREIGDRFGLKYNHAWAIATGRSWKRVHEGPPEPEGDE